VIILQANIPEAGYGKKIVLSGISMEAKSGEIVGLIGPNGAGKSTLLKVLIGLISSKGGRVIFETKDITDRHPEENVRGGLSFLPQGNRVFSELTVRENIEIGGYLIRDKKERFSQFEAMIELFPSLKDRLKQDAGNLSGGEKQQLALARALMLKPRLLLMDEPSLGLSPKLVTAAMETIQRINRDFKTTIVIVEQKVHELLKITHRVYALRMGEVVFEGTSVQLQTGDTLQRIFLV
jgi:branched-chain amino acid transport system ATP-binding protein